MLNYRICPRTSWRSYCNGACFSCVLCTGPIKGFELSKKSATKSAPIAKLPLGIMPKYIHDEQRREELKQAINRFLEADQPIPIEWIEEYNELSKG